MVLKTLEDSHDWHFILHALVYNFTCECSVSVVMDQWHR